jgi:hypothetical protein
MNRVSVEEDDPGHLPARICRGVTVLLDGEVIKDAITADADQGFVICYANDDRGRPRIDRYKPGGGFMRVPRFGHVEIEWPEEGAK